MKKEQTPRLKRGGLEIQPFGDCWINQAWWRKYIEATEELEEKKGRVGGLGMSSERCRTGGRCGWWCGLCGQPNDWRKQAASLAVWEYGGECGNMISSLVTDLINRNELGVEVKDLTQSSKERFVEVFATCVCVDDARALVTMGELARKW